jgi:hypothetical protein
MIRGIFEIDSFPYALDDTIYQRFGSSREAFNMSGKRGYGQSRPYVFHG